MKPIAVAALLLAAALASPRLSRGVSAAGPRPFTVDDEMRLRVIVDAALAPDGADVAYVVSTPSVEKNEHQAALFLVSASGGEPRRLGATLRIFSRPVPRPQLRWTPDGSSISLVAVAGERPQVFTVPREGGEPRPVTQAPEGVGLYEWGPHGDVAYTTLDPLPADEQRRRKDPSFVIRADAPDRPMRLVVQSRDGTRQTVSPPSHYVDAFSWSPDGREIAYAAAPRTGFTSPYAMRIFAVPPAGGAPRVVVDRPGMNVTPQYSPDGRWIAFVTTNGKSEITAPRCRCSSTCTASRTEA